MTNQQRRIAYLFNNFKRLRFLLRNPSQSILKTLFSIHPITKRTCLQKEGKGKKELKIIKIRSKGGSIF